MNRVPTVRQGEVRPAGLWRRLAALSALVFKAPQNLQSVNGDRGNWWWPIIREPFAGAWQQNLEERTETVLTYSAVYACVTLIASDVAKLRVRLVEQTKDGIWIDAESAAFSPVLRKPNRYQNRIAFFEQWVISKLLHGNSYALKERDDRGVVKALHILDATRVKVLVAPDGAVYYELVKDSLAGVEDRIVVPASEIIHDVMVPLYHPLVGVSPLTACGIAALQGLAIQRNSAKFFQNGATPGGVVTVPGDLTQQQADAFKAQWQERFAGENAGKTAVLTNGMKYEPIAMKATDAQLIEQLKWSAETVCSTFHVPPYMIGVGPAPTYNNIEALNSQYYTQCLQKIIESIELCLDEGLGLTDRKDGRLYGTEFDLDDLLRMDSKTAAETEEKLKIVKTVNESRKRFGLSPVKGGDTVFRQHQDYSLEALAKRDAKEDPFATGSPKAEAPSPPAAASDDEPADETNKLIASFTRKALAHASA